MVKNPPANAGHIRDAGSIPGSGRSLEEGMATHSSILAWRIPCTEDPGRLQSMGSQRVGTQLKQLTCMYMIPEPRNNELGSKNRQEGRAEKRMHYRNDYGQPMLDSTGLLKDCNETHEINRRGISWMPCG